MAIYPPNQTTPAKGSGNNVWNWLGSSLKKFAAALQPYLSEGGGGGGQVTETVTYLVLLDMIDKEQLIPGVTYKITGFNKNNDYFNPLPYVLYDDGTNSGITIYMQALSTTEMATSGFGEFYNPKYTGSAEYNNTDGTGLYQIWDGDNPDPMQVPAYQVGDVVFWGGYAWENIYGNVGNPYSETSLIGDWLQLPYTDTNYYEKVVDEIKVDWKHGVIVERHNAATNITVSWTPQGWYWNPYYTYEKINPIALIPWGLYGDPVNGNPQSVAELTVTDSYVELVNFKGYAFIGNTFNLNCSISNNYFGKYTELIENVVMQDSVIINNEFSDTYIKNNTLNNGSGIYFSISTNFSNIKNNTLNNGSDIFNNTLDNSNIQYNTLTDVSYMGNNTLDNSSITNNTLDNLSSITNNTLDNSNIQYNTLTIANFISSNTLTNTSYIESNTLNNGSGIGNNTLTYSGISNNTLPNGSNILNNTLTNSGIYNNTLINKDNISYNTLTYGTIGDNILNNSTINDNTMNNNSIISYNTINFTDINNNTLTLANISYNTSIGYGSITNNTLTNSSGIGDNMLTLSYIYNATLNNNCYITDNILTANSAFNLSASGTLTSVFIQKHTVKGAEIYADISAATHLFNNSYSKDIFTREDGTVRLSYYDNSDVLTVVDVTA